MRLAMAIMSTYLIGETTYKPGDDEEPAVGFRVISLTGQISIQELQKMSARSRERFEAGEQLTYCSFAVLCEPLIDGEV